MITNRFETILADTEEARNIHYHLRYRVFCEETRFEDTARFPQKREEDDYDKYAVHFLVWDRAEWEWVGAMRLIDASQTELPMEEICSKPIIYLSDNRSSAAEFSRLCILSAFRILGMTHFGIFASQDREPAELMPVLYHHEENEILLRLLRASFGYGQEAGIDHCYFIITPALARVLKRFGIPLTVVGDAIEHRGLRIPHRYDVREAEAGMLNKLPYFGRIEHTSPAFVRYTDFCSRRQRESGFRFRTKHEARPESVLFPPGGLGH